MFNPDQLEAALASAWKKLQDSLHQLEAKSTDSLQDILTPAFYYQMNELYVSTIKPSLDMLKTLLLADTSSILYLSSLQPMFDTIFLIVYLSICHRSDSISMENEKVALEQLFIPGHLQPF